MTRAPTSTLGPGFGAGYRARPPGTRRVEAPAVGRMVILGALAAALSAFTILQGINPHDEGLMLQAGARIADGQWPYRDFWTNYPPGQALVLAALDRVLGVNLLSWRILNVLLDAIVSVLAYALARRYAPERYALVVWLAAAGAMAYPPNPGPNPTALALALGALLAAPRRPRAAAVLAGLAVLFRLEIGAAAIIGVVATAPPPHRRAVAAIAIAVAAVTLLPFFVVAPHAMLSDTIGFLRIQHLQRLPFPWRFEGPLRPSKLIEFYIPLILVAGCGLWVVSAVGGAARADPAATLALLALGLVGLGYLLGRTDEFHLVPLAVVLPIMLAAAAAVERRRWLRIALLAALVLVAVHGLERRAGQALHPPAQAAVPGPAGGGVTTTPGDASTLTQLRATVDRLTRPGEAIFVANPRFDLVRVGDPLLYTILDRPNATRYDVMQPGVVTTAPVQREIVRALAGVRVVVRWLNPTASMPEPDGAGRSSGVHILDRYLAANFGQIARYGYYAVLTRRAGSTIGRP